MELYVFRTNDVGTAVREALGYPKNQFDGDTDLEVVAQAASELPDTAHDEPYIDGTDGGVRE